MKNRAYVINLDEYADVGTHWIALYEQNNEVLVLNMFLKKSKDILDIKTQKQTYLEYKQTIQLCLDAFVLDSLIFFCRKKFD